VVSTDGEAVRLWSDRANVPQASASDEQGEAFNALLLRKPQAIRWYRLLYLILNLQ
jgi:hypothetical protein